MTASSRYARLIAPICAAVLALTVDTQSFAQTQAVQPDRSLDPVRPEDRAFDPNLQNVPMRAATQKPRMRMIGTVPITSGLGLDVPVLTLEAPALRLTTETRRWIIDLVVANNSSLTITPEIRCTFMNNEKPVEMVTVFLEGLGPGQKVYFNVFGPGGEIFVDLAPCQVISSGAM
jgi:hypothetical protein